ncbi:hypothetical protein [Thiomicrorhabdus sp.]|uniref:hypothetical protein n=1 Tax=Thiomicrorhabdus sp. TaxID=2039724 RepID=UPI0029C762C4|nr:hypothetical protein [Thiomicrorhabdus sp.]
MKPHFILIALITLLPFTAQADGHKHEPGLANYALLLGKNLPHLMKPVMQNQQQLNLTPEQKQQLKQLREQMAPKIHSGLEQAKKIEQQISSAILVERKNVPELDSQLEKLQTQKWQNTQNLIKAIGQIQTILNEQQYAQLMQILKKNREAKK